MKNMLMIFVIVAMLAGCGVQDTMETLADEPVQAVLAQPREVHVELPEEAVLPALESDNGILYMCSNFDVSVQTLEGGDLQKTIRTVTGYEPDELTILQTQDGEFLRSEFVWSSAGELGDQVCRATVLDDGNYHYVLTAIIDEENAEAYQEIWNGMFETFAVS